MVVMESGCASEAVAHRAWYDAAALSGHHNNPHSGAGAVPPGVGNGEEGAFVDAYLKGSNIAGFKKVADAMLAYGVM